MPASTRTRPVARSTSLTRCIPSSEISVPSVSTASVKEWPAPATRTLSAHATVLRSSSRAFGRAIVCGWQT